MTSDVITAGDDAPPAEIAEILDSLRGRWTGRPSAEDRRAGHDGRTVASAAAMT
jgi:hypothetical protein